MNQQKRRERSNAIESFEQDVQQREFNLDLDLENLIECALNYRVSPDAIETAFFRFVLPYSQLLKMVKNSQLYPTSYTWISKTKSLFLKWQLTTKQDLQQFFNVNAFRNRSWLNGILTILCSNIYPVDIKYNNKTQIIVCYFTYQILKWEGDEEMIIGTPIQYAFFLSKEVDYKTKMIKIKDEDEKKSLKNQR